MPDSRQGFTLIELSIVLVIIGLIVGGILTGKELIRSAEINKVITQKTSYDTAVNAFRTKYNEFPGDMVDATKYWGPVNGNAGDNYTASCWGNIYTPPYTCNGNGDGMIGYNSTQFFQIFGGNGEMVLFWQHLANAGMISGNYVASYVPYSGAPYLAAGTQVANIPVSQVNNTAAFAMSWLCMQGDPTLFSDVGCGHFFFYGAQSTVANDNYKDMPLYPILTGEDARRLDAKIDDGKPGTGSVTSPPAAYIFSQSCATTNDLSTAVYNTGVGGPICSLIFKAGF